MDTWETVKSFRDEVVTVEVKFSENGTPIDKLPASVQKYRIQTGNVVAVVGAESQQSFPKPGTKVLLRWTGYGPALMAYDAGGGWVLHRYDTVLGDDYHLDFTS